MRRVTITLSAALMLVAFAPAGALARHGHHQRGRHHSRIARFGSDRTGGPSSSSSTTSSSPSTNAGTVQSFSNGILTIVLNDGSTVSGAVTNDTEIECSMAAQAQSTHDDGDPGSGDQSGGSGDQSQGSGDQGDDQNENENQNACSSSNLTTGAVVQGAELRITSTGNVWKQVELGA